LPHKTDQRTSKLLDQRARLKYLCLKLLSPRKPPKIRNKYRSSASRYPGFTATILSGSRDSIFLHTIVEGRDAGLPHAPFIPASGNPELRKLGRRPLALQINFASKVISALRTLDTGQFFSASPAIRANAAWSRFGTCARSVSADLLIRNPCPS